MEKKRWLGGVWDNLTTDRPWPPCGSPPASLPYGPPHTPELGGQRARGTDRSEGIGNLSDIAFTDNDGDDGGVEGLVGVGGSCGSEGVSVEK